MTRDDALLKLLAIEPECPRTLVKITGWPPHETLDVLQRLLMAGQVAYQQVNHAQLFYAVNSHAQAMAQKTAPSPALAPTNTWANLSACWSTHP